MWWKMFVLMCNEREVELTTMQPSVSELNSLIEVMLTVPC
jgi:hypothetical protein